MSTADTHDFSQDELLERKLRAALLEKDYGQVKTLLRAAPRSNALKGGVLDAAVQLNALEIVRFVFEEDKLDLSPETGMMFLLEACKKNQRDIALYLCERLTIDLGLTRSDTYTLLFEKFPPEEHEQLTKDILAQTAARQDSLNKMLFSAIQTKSFALIPALVQQGASVNENATDALYAFLKSFPLPADETDTSAQQDYEAAFAAYLTTDFQNKAVLMDAALIIAAFQLAEEKQSEKIIATLLAQGADAFGNGSEAEKIILQKFTPPADKVFTPAEHAAADAQKESWREKFAAAQAAEVAENHQKFNTLFGQDYRPADLLAPVGDDGDTGLMMAAKAKLLPQVIARAQKMGNKNITLEKLTQTNARLQSCLSLCVDRGTLGQVMQPAYWLAQEPALLEKLETLLTPKQMQNADMQAIKSSLRHHILVQKGSRLRLAPRPAQRPCDP